MIFLGKGGKSSAKQGQSRAIRAVSRAFGSVSHRLLVFSSSVPRPLLCSPLCTTFYHILAVSRLLSRRNFKVGFPLLDPIQKIPALVVTNSRTTRDCVYCLGSFAVLSLRFFLTSAPDAEFPVEKLAGTVYIHL